MSTFTKYKVYLTPSQQDKVKLAFKNGKNCSLRIEPKAGNTDLMLTNSQINHIIQNKKQNKSTDINLSKTQLEKSEGFLPLLAAALPVVLQRLLVHLVMLEIKLHRKLWERELKNQRKSVDKVQAFVYLARKELELI